MGYCGLKCYKSAEHQLCAEGFYRQNLQQDLASQRKNSAEDPTKKADYARESGSGSKDQAKVEALVKAYQQMVIEGLDDDTRDSDEDEFAEMAAELQNIDLERVSVEAIWEKMSVKQRRKFISITNSAEGMKTLCDQAGTWVPWWTGGDPRSDIGKSRVVEVLKPEELAQLEKDLPKPLENVKEFHVLLNRPKSDTTLNPSLFNNAIEMILVFVVACRWSNGNLVGHGIELAELFWKLSDVLGQTTGFAYGSISESIDAVIAKLRVEYQTTDDEILVLLADVKELCTSWRFAELALAELHRYFDELCGKPAFEKCAFKSKKKLEYYISYTHALAGHFELSTRLLASVHQELGMFFDSVKQQTEHRKEEWARVQETLERARLLR